MLQTRKEKRHLQQVGDIGRLVSRELVKTFLDRPLIESDIWRERPVSIKDFCDLFIKEPLFDEQQKLCDAVFGTDPLKWDYNFKHFVVFWGKGSGKDRTVAKIFAYTAYKLLCMKDPWDYFHQGKDEAFDLINVSINARQAKNVFFKKLKAIVKNTINPKTGKNWFVERGANLDQGEGIQTVEINLPYSISCHSLNSDTFTGEGHNIFLAVVDEKGGMKGGKGVDITENLAQSSDSRFPKYGKILDISFMYHPNDDMDITYRKSKDDPSVYRTRKSTWEVNPFTKKTDFARHFKRNKNKAMMTYMCKGIKGGGNAIPDKQLIYDAVSHREYKNPIMGMPNSTDNLFTLKFHEWFRGDPSKLYTCGVDLAKGKTIGDDVGFCLAHSEMLLPTYKSKLIKNKKNDKGEVETEIWDADDLVNMQSLPKKGCVADLVIQIIAPEVGEVRFSDIRRFIINVLRDKFGFNIVLVSYDGYQSVESIQELNFAGIQAKLRSVDKSNDSYESWIDLMGDRVFRTYRNEIMVREAEELMIDPDTGKFDHPALSFKRSITEGKEKGSKDVTDAVVQATMNCLEDLMVGGGFVA